MTTKNGPDGSLILYRNGEEVGGVSIIDFPNATELCNRIEAEGFTTESHNDVASLVDLVKPEGQKGWIGGYQSERGLQYGVFLEEPGMTPEMITASEMHHRFLPNGDVFYDLYFQRSKIPDSEQQILDDSFTLAP